MSRIMGVISITLLLTGCTSGPIDPQRAPSRLPPCPSWNRLEKLGRTFYVADPWRAIDDARKKVATDERVYVYRPELTFVGGIASSTYRAVVLKNVDDEEFLKLVQVDAVNFDISNDDIRAKVTDWRANYGADVHGASCDSMDIVFHNVDQKNVDALVDDICRFCPDIEGQGTSKSEVRDALLSTGQFDFWWD